jgi:hypothetical protein
MNQHPRRRIGTISFAAVTHFCRIGVRVIENGLGMFLERCSCRIGVPDTNRGDEQICVRQMQSGVIRLNGDFDVHDVDDGVEWRGEPL